MQQKSCVAKMHHNQNNTRKRIASAKRRTVTVFLHKESDGHDLFVAGAFAGT